jgi:hypothetical protein
MSDARETLVRAMDAIAAAEQRLGDGSEFPYVGVVYYGVRKGDDGQNTEVGGWVHSDQPSWVVSALFERAAAALSEQLTPIGTFGGEEEDDA